MKRFGDVVTFGPELDGDGWYDVQERTLSNGTVENYRWTSAKPAAKFRFIALDYREIYIRMELAGLITPHVIPHLSVFVDERECPFTFSATNGGFPMFMSCRSARAGSAPVSELVIRSGRTWSPNELDRNAPDRRQLAVALVRASVTSADDLGANNPAKSERRDVRHFMA